MTWKINTIQFNIGANTCEVKLKLSSSYKTNCFQNKLKYRDIILYNNFMYSSIA